MNHGFSKIALSLGFIASATVFNVAQATSLVAINSANQIGVFDSKNADKASFVNISGFQSAGESFLGIDLRPSNNMIYGISTASKLYTVDAYTGAASFIAALTGYTVNTKLGYGIDFNPQADRTANASLRVVTSAGDNLAVNANSGAVTTQTTLKTTLNGSKVATGYTNVAYINSDPTQKLAPADTDLYYLNFEKDVQAVALAAFNNPQIDLVGKIGFDILSAGGFEIFSRNGTNTAYAAVNVKDDDDDKDDDKKKGKSKDKDSDKEENEIESFLLEIDLKTGKAKKLGEFDFDGYLTGLTSAPSPVPVPAAAWLLGSALLGFVSFKRKSV